jgi:hypothetical protein
MAKLYQTSNGFDMVTSDNRLYSIYKSVKWVSQFKGVVSDYRGGRLVRKIPNDLKQIFFELQKQ